MTGQREQARRRRAELLDAALTAFANKGFDRASVKDIAAEAGVTPGLLYHYFPGKQALLMAVLAERGFLPELRKRLATGGQRPTGKVLVELAAGFARLLAERADLVRLFFSGATTSDPSVREGLSGFVAEGRRLLASYLASRIAAGELRVHDTETAAQMLLSVIVLGQVTEHPPDPGAVVELLLHGLAMPPPDSRHPSKED